MEGNVFEQTPDERGKFDGWWYFKQLRLHTERERLAAWLAWQAGREELLKEQGEKDVQVNAD